MNLRKMAASSLLLLLVAAGTPGDTEKPLELFNGKDLDGWLAEGDKEYKDGTEMKPVWVAKDGLLSCMVGSRSYGFLRYTPKEFGDFHLHVEYRMGPKATPKSPRCNSGIGIRTVPFDPKRSAQTRPSFAAYEVQIQDDGDLKPDKHTSGSLYNYVAPQMSAARPAGEWNVMAIECVGPRITITLNDKKVLDVDQTTIAEIKDKPLKGYICLQNHGGKIDFRNLRVREIKR